MKSFKVGDKVKLMTSHYLFNDWAVGKSGVVRKLIPIINSTFKSYMIEIDKQSLWVEGGDLCLERQNAES